MKSVLTKLAGLAGIIAILALTGCSEGVGLGESVDTESPTLSITYPPLGSAIMENFVVAGTCGDDKAVTKVEVTLKRIDKETKIVETRNAEIASDQKSWQIEFNPFLGDEELGYNGWTLADGNYAVDVIAYDNAGHKSGLASTSFEIDNTAPFFVLSSPAVVYGSSNFTELGSVFAVEGTIVDDHSIDEMEVNIFDSTGTQVNATPYIENDIATAGGTSVQIARYIENGTTTVNQRYEEIYDVSSSHYGTTEQYYCSIRLTDNAKLYQDPADSGVSMGNTTSTVYLYDDVYQSLVSDKAGKGLSYAVLKTILNKTAAETVTGTNGATSTSSEVLSALTSAAKNTGLQDEAPSFSLNPAANPTYAVSGFQYEFTDGFIPQDGSAGGTITVTASMGLDEVKLLPQTMKVWIIDSDTTPLTETELDSKIQKLTALTKAAMYQDAENPTKATLEFDEETLTNIKNETGFVLLYDYKDYSKGSVSSVTIPVVLDKDIMSIVQDKYYFVAVTGNDADLVEFSQKNYYGFHGQAAGTPPTIAISTPKNNSYQATSEFSYTGKITTKETPFKSLEFKLTVVDESTDTTLDDYIYVKSTYNSNTKTWTDEAGLTIAADGTWTFTPSQADGYAKIAVGEGTAYLYSLYALVTSASGQSQKIEEYSVRIDRITPVVEFTAVTPVIEGNNFYEGAQDKNHTYVNGTIEFKGSIAENYSLKSVYYKIFVDGIEKYSSLDPDKLVTKTSFNNSIDTPDYEDGKEIEVIVYAEDVVGHVGSASTKAYNKEIYGLEENIVINQDTDKPQIKFSNADSTVTDVSGIDSTTNFFSSTNKNLLANLSDDDAIAGAKVTFYKADGTTEVGTVTKTGKISQLSVAVPSEEGTYFAEVTATDSNGTETVMDKFCFVVDNNAPDITYTSLKGYYGTGDSAIEFTVTANDQLMDGLTVGIKHNDATVEDLAANYVTVTELTGTTTQKSYKVRVSLKDGSDNWTNNGSWIFTFTADDKVGRSNVVNTIELTVDTNPPTLEISQEPSSRFIDKTSSQIYRGTYVESKTESGIAGLYYTIVDKGAAAPDYTSSWKDVSFKDGGWTATADFSELTENNSYDIYFAAVDNSGNIGYAKGTAVTLDASAPVVTANAVGWNAARTKATASGTVTELNLESITVSVTATGTNDSNPPTFYLGDAASGTALTKGEDNYSGTFEYNSTDNSAYIASLSTGSAAGYSYSFTGDGSYIVTVSAKDKAGKSEEASKKQFTFDMDSTAPTINVNNTLASTGAEIFDQETYTFTGTWSDNLAGTKELHYTVNGTEQSVITAFAGQTNWRIEDIPLTEGSDKSFTFWATDQNGNTSEVTSFTGITVDFAKPVIATTFALNSAARDSIPTYIADGATLVISGTITESSGLSSIDVVAKKSGTTVASGNSGYTLAADNAAKTFTITLVGGSASNGSWTFDITTTDVAGRVSKTTSLATEVDMTPPVWKNSWTENAVTKYFQVSGKNHVLASGHNWYNGASLKFDGCFEETGSGVNQIYAWVAAPGAAAPATADTSTATSSFVGTTSNGYHTWSSNIGEFIASSTPNSVYFVAVDNAGNTSAVQQVEIYRDELAPVIDTDAGTVLTNGVLDIALSGTVTDDASGVASVALNFTYGASSTWEGNATLDTSVTPATWSATIPASVLANLTSGTVYQVKAVALDNAGNKYNGNAIKIDVDTTAPVATISAALSRTTGLNGTNTLSGTVTDGHKPVSFKLFYTLTDPSSATTPADNSGKPAGWTQIGDEIITEQDIYNWSGFDFDFTAKSAAASAADGKDTVYILPVAVDEAGNCNAYTKANNGTIAWNLNPDTGAQWEEFAVDLSKDRPTVKFSDLTDLSASGDASKLIIKNSTGGKITGLVTDDDSTTEKVVDTFIISSSVITSADGFTLTTSGDVVTATADGKGTTTYNRTSGDWTYTPPSEDDGNKTVYIYIKDNNSHEFYSTATAAGYTVYNNPRFQVKTGTVMDNKAVLTYKSDNNSPSVESIQVAYSDSSSIADNATFADFAATTKLGGTVRRYARFKVTAKDSNGIDDIALELTGTLASGGAVPAVTMTGTTTTDNSATSWLSSVVDLDSFASGYVSVKATATDTSSMTGNGNNSFYCDQDVETENFMVNNPAATSNGTNEVSNDILTSTISMAGSATESLGAGIAKVSWLVPPCDSNGNEVTYATIIADPDSYSWSSNKSSDTYTQWKFAFDDGTNTEDDKTHNPTFETMSYSANTAGGYYMTVSSGIYTIPVYFMIEDELGNVGFVGNYRLRYNPDADRPSSSILDPQTGATVGDRIRITGSAEDDRSVSAVYLQISSVKNSTTGEITWSSDDAVLAAAQTAGESNSDSTYLDVTTLANSGITNVYNASSCPTGVESTWWGIKAENTISWALVINKYGKFELEGGTQTIYVRVCAVDDHGKAGIWSDPVTINIVQGAPTITFVETAQFTNNTIASGESSKYTSYDAGSYLTNQNGQWYIVANAYHASKISSIEVKSSVTGRNLTATASVSDIQADNETKFGYFYKTTSDSNVNVKIYIPVDTRFEGDITYTITAKEAGNNKSNTQSYTYKIDNTAPTIGELTSGNTRNTSLATVAGNKLVNSNGGLTSISTILNEEYSGFTMMAYYFLKDGKVYNPIPGGSSAGFTNQTATGYATTALTENAVTDDHNLYGVNVTLTGTTDSDGTGVYVTASALSDSNVRAGGLIQIDGIYYQIKSVTGTRIYVTGLSTTCTATTAFCPYALAIQYVSTIGDTNESIASGTPSEGYTMTENDGDGIIETVNKAGSKYTLQTSIMSDELPDGETDIICVAFDKAGNISSSKTTTMISNNLPRLSKVFLATDLNGDDKFEPFEFEYKQSVNDVNTSAYAYSCLTATGQGQEGVTLTTTDSAGTKFAVRDKLTVTMELLSGANTSGSYAGIKYIAKLSDSEADGPATGVAVTGSLSDTVTGVDSTTSITDPVFDSLTAISGKGILFTNANFTSGNAAALTGMADAYENTTSLATQTYLQLSLWDTVNIAADSGSTYIATKDTTDTDGKVTSYGNQYTYINIPVYIDIVDDVAPKGTITPFYWTKEKSSGGAAYSDNNSLYFKVTEVESTASYDDKVTDEATSTTKYYTYTPMGHIELADKPSVSGVIKVEGTVSDDQRLTSIALTYGGTDVGSITYTASTQKWSTAGTIGNGYVLSAADTTFGQAGHEVKWTLLLDTAKFDNAATKAIVVTATQAKAGTSTTASATYNVSAVPYITGISRPAGTNTYHSSTGRTSVIEGETLTVTGFNFGTSGSWTIGISGSGTYTGITNSSPTAAASFTLTVPANSGALTVTSTTASLNNSNATSDYNKEVRVSGVDEGTFRDDRYVYVWNVNHTVSGSSAISLMPTIDFDSTGKIISSWTQTGKSTVNLSRGIDNAAEDIFVCYDQPTHYSALGVSKTSGDMGVTFFPDHVGAGGIFGDWGLGNNEIVGGVGFVAVNSNSAITKSTQEKGRSPLISANATATNTNYLNPNIGLDGNVDSPYYPIGTHEFARNPGSFSAPQTVRYGNNGHSLYYDETNGSLKYVYIPISTDNNATEAYNNGRMFDVVVIDGPANSYDRQHETGIGTGTNRVNFQTGGDNDYPYMGTGGGYYKYDYPTVQDSASGTNQTHAFTVNGSTVTVTFSSAAERNAWKTLYDSNGASMAFITAANAYDAFPFADATNCETVGTTQLRYTFADAVPSCNSVTIWGGHKTNVTGVGGRSASTATAGYIATASSAGEYSSIDVTSTGVPVIMYKAGSSIRLAYTTSTTPAYSDWTVMETGLSGGLYISMKIDTANSDKLHAVYKNGSKLMYVSATRNTTTGAYTFGTPEVIDTTGSLTMSTLSLYGNAPVVSYLNSESSEDGVKYAKKVTLADGTTVWDYSVIPAVVSGGTEYYVSPNNYRVYVGANAGSWSATQDSISMAGCEAFVGFKTTRIDILFLKKE